MLVQNNIPQGHRPAQRVKFGAYKSNQVFFENYGNVVKKRGAMFLKDKNDSFLNTIPTEIENEINQLLAEKKLEDVCFKKTEVEHLRKIFREEVMPDYKKRSQNYSSLKTPNEQVPWVVAIKNSSFVRTVKHYIMSALETPSDAQMAIKKDEFFGQKIMN